MIICFSSIVAVQGICYVSLFKEKVIAHITIRNRFPGWLVFLKGKIMEAVNLVCFSCKHFRITGGCDAFPDGIPDEITSGMNEHEKPLAEQGNDIVFEPKEERNVFLISE